MTFTTQYQSKLLSAIRQVDLRKVSRAVGWFREARDSGRSIFVFGNGGSAATASHFVCDMVKGASYGCAKRFRILALTDSVPTLTAYSNDLGYEFVFAEQLKNFAEADDVVMGISGSGNSGNVIKAVETANAMGCRTIGLTGRDGGRLRAVAKLNIHVPEGHMGRIEDVHMMVCHMISYSFMEAEEHDPRKLSQRYLSELAQKAPEGVCTVPVQAIQEQF
jgi:D-sedoheptulose 7-phosphate isomerase